MHILLTDILTCPRCGPDFGLILLADRIDDRRVIEGALGCSNCREQYPIHHGAVDLRLPGATSAEATDTAAGASPDDAEAAVRTAALLGLANAQGTVLLAGSMAGRAAGLVEIVPGVEVIALVPETGDVTAMPGVTRMAGARAPLPFRGAKLRGAALAGVSDPAALSEALRVLAPGARLLVENAPLGTADALAGLGAQVMLDQEGTVVARAVGEPVQLRMNALR